FAELVEGLVARVGLGHSLADEVVDAHLEVEAQLVVDVALRVGAPEAEVSSPARRPTGEGHSRTLMASLGLRRAGEHGSDRGDVGVPAVRFGAECAAAGGRQPIELRTFAFLGVAPLGLDPAALFHPME